MRDVDAQREKILLSGETPNPLDISTGCCFHNRCPWVQDHCVTSEPELRTLYEESKIYSMVPVQIYRG